MYRLIATLAAVKAYVLGKVEVADRERGSITVEQVFWAAAILVVAGIVLVAITSYVSKTAARIS